MDHHEGHPEAGPTIPEAPQRSARDLLSKLSISRITVDQIKFTEDSSRFEGAFGQVAIGTLAPIDGTASETRDFVAVKILKVGVKTDVEKFLRLFFNELHIMEQLSHPNIVKIIGFVEDIDNQVAWLVTPWEANGNVREFLRSGDWDMAERVSLIKDVVDGVKYLHSRRPPVCHGDLKSLNILVNALHRAIITDFGSARVHRKAGYSTHPDHSPRPPVVMTTVSNETHEVTLSVSETEITLTGPSWSLRWAAPEVLNGEEPNLGSDIWALGWIAWEVITDKYPFSEVSSEGAVTYKIIKGQLPLIKEDEQLAKLGNLFHIMRKCWKFASRERPSAADCSGAIQWIPSEVPLPRRDGKNKIHSISLLMANGEIHNQGNRSKEALKAFEQALTMALLTNNAQNTALALRMCADIHKGGRNYTEAENLYNRSIEIYAAIGNDSGRANAALGLGELHLVRSHFEKAEEFFAKALAIHTKMGFDLGRANALRSIAQTQRMRCQFSDAEKSDTEALAICTSIMVDSGRANALEALGGTYVLQFEYDQAEKRYRQALAIHESTGNDLGRARTLNGLSQVLSERSKLDEAEDYCKEALIIHQKAENWFDIASAMFNLARVQDLRGEYDKAEHYYIKSKNISARIDNPLGSANSLLLIGSIQGRRGDSDKAI
ncbi:hypothetical protein FRB90_002655, partial [Tulasnella sp. 427]